MAVTAGRSRGQVTRNRFMVAVFGGMATVIGLVYVGVIGRYLWPKGAGDTPPLRVKLNDKGVVDPESGNELAFKNGVAGPFYYPTTEDKSVVVGVFVAKKNPAGPLAANNLDVVEQTCTHLGCPVIWADTALDGKGEFQCPCHGSRFNRDRSVANGPAADPLWPHDFTLAGDTITILKRGKR